jgi:uncharacterized protein (DUF58 family)
MKEFHYRVSWRARGSRPGHHAGLRHGAGMEFSGHAPLHAAPDPRRVDVRASLSNPFGGWLVRLYRQRASIPVWLIADLSASMGFVGVRRKFDMLLDLAQSLSYSVQRTGDAFGLIGCGSGVLPQFVLPATHARGACAEMLARLTRHEPDAPDARGMLAAADLLGRQRALVFLASDFHFSLDVVDALLSAFGWHEVVPVVIRDEAECERLPAFGLAQLRDAESGRQRTVWLRPRLREAWRKNWAIRCAALDACFARHHLRPLILSEAFEPDAATALFYSRDSHAHP